MLVTGAGGFARQLLEALDQLDLTAGLAFYDDISRDAPAFLHGKFRVLKSAEEAKGYFSSVAPDYLLGTGNPGVRKAMADKFNAMGGRLGRVISPCARISKYDCSIEAGVAVLSGCLVEGGVSIGYGSLINLNCTIAHDSVIGKFCELSPGTIVSGGGFIGDMTYLGAGAIVLPKVKIGNHAVIAAGAVVTQDVDDGQKVAGNPARSMKE